MHEDIRPSRFILSLGEVLVGKIFLGCLVLLLFPVFLHGQAVSPVSPKTAELTAGGFFSYGQTDYGQNHAMGPGAYADFNYYLHGGNLGVGLEGEARFLNFHLVAGTYEQNFLVGPRVSYTLRNRFQPYAKFLVGGSRFHYPTFISNQVYTYTTYAIGGGIDVHMTNRITLRPADFEYQHWSFPPTGLTPWVYSVGASYRIF